MGRRWRCSCGELVLIGYTQCWKCGSIRSEEGEVIPAPSLEDPEPARRSTGALRALAARAGTEAGGPSVSQAQVRPTSLWLEFGVVLLLFFFPSISYALWDLLDARPARSLRDDSIVGLIIGLQLSVPLLYIMARSGIPWSDFGFARPRLVLDGLVAGLIFLLQAGAERLVCPFLHVLIPFEFLHSARPVGAPEHVLFIASRLVNAFEQELFSRAYLVPRLEALFKSTGAAVLSSSVAFAAYHLYQGPAGMLCTFLVGLIYTSAFAVTRRVWPLVLAHALTNILASR